MFDCNDFIEFFKYFSAKYKYSIKYTIMSTLKEKDLVGITYMYMDL